MADIFGNPTKPLNKKNQSEYKTDIFGNPISISKPQKPFYTPEPTLTPLQKILKSKPIQQKKITIKTTLPKTEEKLAETNKAVKGLKTALNFTKNQILELNRQTGIAADYTLANLPSRLMKFYARNNSKLPDYLKVPWTEEEINKSLTPRKLSEGGAADYIATGIGYIAGAVLGGNAAKALTTTKGATVARAGSLTPKLKEIESKKSRIIDSLKEGAKAEAIYSAAQTGGKALFEPKDFSTAQEFKNLAFNLGAGAVGNTVVNEVSNVLAKQIAKKQFNKQEVSKLREEILKPIEQGVTDSQPIVPVGQETLPSSGIKKETVTSKVANQKPITSIEELNNVKIEDLPFLTSEQKEAIKSLKFVNKSNADSIKKSTLNKQDKNKQLNLLAKTLDSDIRKAVQGKYFISIPNGLNQSELENKIFDFLKPKVDDIITFENQKVKVLSNSKGIAKLEFPDGTVKKVFSRDIDKYPELIELMQSQRDELEKLTGLKSSELPEKTMAQVVEEPSIITKEPTIYKESDTLIHKDFGEGKVLSKSESKGLVVLQIEFKDGTIKYIQENSPAITLLKSAKVKKVSDAIQSQLDKNAIDIKNAKKFPENKIYSSIVPLPSKLQQLYIKRGALYIAKGVVEFGEWSKIMIQDLGDSVKPHLKKIFKESTKQSENILSEIEKSLVSPIRSEKLRASAKGKKREAQVPVTISKKETGVSELTEQVVKNYRQLGNQQTLEAVQKDLVKNGIDVEYKNLMKSKEPSAYNTVMAGRLIDEFQKRADNLRRQGKFDEAESVNQDIVDLMDDLKDKLNNAGQATQAMALYNKLDENGILLFVKKQIDKLNKQQNTTTKLNPSEVQNVTDIAKSLKKSTGIENIGNRVLDIIDESKKRDLTEIEMQEVANFVNDADVFVKETIVGTNKYKSASYTEDVADAVLPDKLSNPDVKKEVSDFINKHASDSKKAIKNSEKQKSMTPLDVYSDYVVIGASQIINGNRNFTKWSASMVGELGDSVKPYLKDVFSASKKAVKNTVDKITDPEIKRVMKYIDALLKRQKLNTKDFQEARDMAKEITKLSGDAKQESLEDLEIFLNSKYKANLGQRLSSFTRIAQLLNPKTLGRNAIGNELFYRGERLTKYIATPIDIVASKLSGKERSVTFKTYNQESYWRNWLKGAKAGWKGTTLQYNLNTQFDLDRLALQDRKFVKYLEKALGATLYSFDYAAYRRANNDLISEMATLKAINNKINLNKLSKADKDAYYENFSRNAGEEIIKLSDEYGRYVTFQDDNVISMILQKSKRGLNKLSPIKDYGFGNLVINYPKTPGALLMRALEYSPAGIARSLYHLALFVTKNPKVPTKRKAVEDLSRAFFGTTGLTAIGWFALENGILLPTRDKDYDKAELNRQTGVLGNQLNFSALQRFVNSGFKAKQAEPKKGDILMTYDWAQPLSLSLLLGSSARSALKEEQEKPNNFTGYAKTAYDSFLGSTETILQQPVLQNLQSLLTIYPGDLTKQILIDKPVSLLQSIPASFTPTVFNQFRQILDNSVRETYDPNWLTSSIKKSIAKTPVISKQLPAKYDTLGNLKNSFQESFIQNKFGKKSVDIFNVFLNPSFVTRYNPTPEASFVLDLIDKTNKPSLAPRIVLDKNMKLLSGDSTPENLVLSGKQYAELQKLTGEKVRNALLKLKQAKIPDSEKAKILEKILTESYKKSKNEIFIKYKDDFLKQLEKGE